MIVIENKHEIGDTVYLKTDKEQLPRIVISFEYYKTGELLYKLASGITTSYHYDFEMIVDKDVNM